MPSLIADFKADVLDMARHYLSEQWGAENVPNDDSLILFFDSQRRRPAILPRKVCEADNYHCPGENAAGWEVLRRKIINGEDLGPHLSRTHSSLANVDGLLNEWGVHHFHIGEVPSFRSGPLVFALVTHDCFYAINVFRHGGWESSDIIESVHRNWPQVINRYRVKGIQERNLGVKQRRQLRKSKVQAFVTTNDGTVYTAIGGGVALSGVAATAVIQAAKISNEIKRLQVAVQEQLGRFIVHLSARGYVPEKDIKATLVGIAPEGYQIRFPDYDVLFNVQIEQNSLHAD
jgi:hypothetical protein